MGQEIVWREGRGGGGVRVLSADFLLLQMGGGELDVLVNIEQRHEIPGFIGPELIFYLNGLPNLNIEPRHKIDAR